MTLPVLYGNLIQQQYLKTALIGHDFSILLTEEQYYECGIFYFSLYRIRNIGKNKGFKDKTTEELDRLKAVKTSTQQRKRTTAVCVILLDSLPWAGTQLTNC